MLAEKLKRRIKQGPSAVRDLVFGKGRIEAKFRDCVELLPKRIQPPAGRVLRILYCKGPYDYSSARRGISIEEISFLHTLMNMPVDVIRVDPEKIVNRFGPEVFAEILKHTVHWYNPDIAFFSETRKECVEGVSYISKECDAITVNWACDDQWAFDKTGPIAKHFNYVVTTDPQGVAKYRSIGFLSAIYGMWGCNHFLFRPMPCAKVFDVAFIGQVYGYRGKMLAYLKKNGIRVSVFGFGTSGGRLTFSEMVETINRAKLCLNFSGGSDGRSEQIKARNFEVAGCNTLLLTEYTAGIDKFYESGKEVEYWGNEEELLVKILDLLENRDKIREVSYGGFMRTRKEHTYVHRFCELFEKINVENAGRLREQCIDFGLMAR